MAETIHVKLPDGSVRDVPQRNHRSRYRQEHQPTAGRCRPGRTDQAAVFTTETAMAIIRRRSDRRRSVPARQGRRPPHRPGASAGAGCRAAYPDRERSRVARRIPPFVGAPDGRRRLELFPETKLGHGPSTDSGFFYDFYRPTPFTPDDLEDREEDARAGAAGSALRAGLPASRSGAGEVQGRRRLHEVPLHRGIHQARREGFVI